MKFMSALIQEVIRWTTKPSLDFDNEAYEDCNIVNVLIECAVTCACHGCDNLFPPCYLIPYFIFLDSEVRRPSPGYVHRPKFISCTIHGKLPNKVVNQN